jgi:hypothetical protein
MICDGPRSDHRPVDGVLELKACRTCCLSECSNTAVIPKTAAIEANLLHASRLCPLRNRLANRFGCGSIASVRHLLPHRFVGSARRHKCATAGVIDDLGIDVFVRAKHRQPRPIRSSLKPLANTKATTSPLAKVRSCVVHCFSFPYSVVTCANRRRARMPLPAPGSRYLVTALPALRRTCSFS